MRTPRITKAFIAERDELLKEETEVLDPSENLELALSKPHPSKEFCKIFFDRLERGNELALPEYGGRDAEDYHTWGYALYGDVDIEAEDEIHKLFLWEWLLHYKIMD